MFRYIGATALFVALICLVFAPAGLLRHFVSDVPGLHVVSPKGTLWSGAGGIIVQGEQIGSAEWSLQPLSLFAFELAWEVRFSGRDATLHGDVRISPGTLRGKASGVIGVDAINYTLAPWDTRIESPVSVEHLEATFEDQSLTMLDGQLTWPGGATSWLMDGGTSNATLPPMTAVLSSQDATLSGLMVPVDGQIPVVQVTLAPDGALTVKISKLLTRLVGRPWPGSDPDHAIVVEMVDDVF